MKKWDGQKRFYETHNQDHSLKTAVKDSVVWYFQETARDVGVQRMQEYLDKVGYGNNQIGKSIDTFWLAGPLEVSIEDQLDFVTRLYKEELSFDQDVIKTVKQIIINEEGEGWILSGKTGTSEFIGGVQKGWFIGYIESGKKAYTFVTKIEGGKGASGPKAKEITKAILEDLGLLQ